MPHLAQDDMHDRVQMTAVCDPVPGRAEATAEQFNIPWAFENYKDLRDSKLVDTVTIATLNKSMITTVEEADDLIASAQQSDLQLVASPGKMLRPLNRRIRELILEGALGKLVWAVTGAAFGQYHEREFRGEMLPCDMDDNTLLTLDFGQSLFGVVYGTAAGSLPDIGRFAIFGLNGSIRSGKLNG